MKRSITHPVWRIIGGSTTSGSGDSPRVHDVYVFEDGSYEPSQSGANFSVYGLRVAAEVLGIVSEW